MDNAARLEIVREAQTFRTRLGSATYTVTVEGDAVRIEGLDSRFTVAALTGDEYRVVTLDAVVHAMVARDGNVRWVFVEGDTYEIEMEAERAEPRRRSGSRHDSLAAPMPATVVKIQVKPGARVRAGDTLVVLEAMKMELPITAPHDGAVTAIHCREGELVKTGARLVELSEANDEG